MFHIVVVVALIDRHVLTGIPTSPPPSSQKAMVAPPISDSVSPRTTSPPLAPQTTISLRIPGNFPEDPRQWMDQAVVPTVAQISEMDDDLNFEENMFVVDRNSVPVCSDDLPRDVALKKQPNIWTPGRPLVKQRAVIDPDDETLPPSPLTSPKPRFLTFSPSRTTFSSRFPTLQGRATLSAHPSPSPSPHHTPRSVFRRTSTSLSTTSIFKRLTLSYSSHHRARFFRRSTSLPTPSVLKLLFLSAPTFRKSVNLFHRTFKGKGGRRDRNSAINDSWEVVDDDESASVENHGKMQVEHKAFTEYGDKIDRSIAINDSQEDEDESASPNNHERIKMEPKTFEETADEIDRITTINDSWEVVAEDEYAGVTKDGKIKMEHLRSLLSAMESIPSSNAVGDVSLGETSPTSSQGFNFGTQTTDLSHADLSLDVPKSHEEETSSNVSSQAHQGDFMSDCNALSNAFIDRPLSRSSPNLVAGSSDNLVDGAHPNHHYAGRPLPRPPANASPLEVLDSILPSSESSPNLIREKIGSSCNNCREGILIDLSTTDIIPGSGASTPRSDEATFNSQRHPSAPLSPASSSSVDLFTEYPSFASSSIQSTSTPVLQVPTSPNLRHPRPPNQIFPDLAGLDLSVSPLTNPESTATYEREPFGSPSSSTTLRPSAPPTRDHYARRPLPRPPNCGCT